LEHIQELELCQSHYTEQEQKQKYVPKLASGEWFALIAPLNQVQDQMPIQENKSCFV
jgi:hypothetical protein